MSRIAYRSAREPNPDNATPLADTDIIQLTLPRGIIEIRHKGDHIEIEPSAGNQVFISLQL